MNSIELVCDQAIFTSIRTPTGEGYRIVAASTGLKPEERQTITRNSPSHESICVPPDDGEQAMAVAFYSLPTRRLCVAFSCQAGAEHTGRGGFRVYTLNVVVSREDFARCAYNPFNIVRGMAAAGLTQPMLKPQPLLPQLALNVSLEAVAGAGPSFPGELKPGHRARVLELALAGQGVLFNLPRNWMSTTEAILLGLPGQLRDCLSFSAGLKSSANRKHRLQLLHEQKSTARARGSAQRGEYVDLESDCIASKQGSAWIQFVERHWQVNDFATLSRRTSRSFSGTKTADLDQVGDLYNLIDSLEKQLPVSILESVAAQIRGKQSSNNTDIVEEYLCRAGETLTKRLARVGAVECAQTWLPLVNVWRQSQEGRDFASPIVVALLQSWAGRDAVSAADAALDLTRLPGNQVWDEELESALEYLLSRLAAATGRLSSPEADRAYLVCSKWHQLRPKSRSLAAILAKQQ